MLWAPPAAEVCVIGQAPVGARRLTHGPRRVTVVDWSRR
jgi:hypothetical protein